MLQLKGSFSIMCSTNYVPKSTDDNPTYVLLVDDNRLYREAFRRQLVLNNYVVAEAEDSASALERIASDLPDVVITDLQMRTEHEGLELIDTLRDAWPLLPVIMISAIGTLEDGASAVNQGAMAVISKAKIEENMCTLFEALDKACTAQRENRSLLEHIEQIRRQIDAIQEAEEEGKTPENPLSEETATELADLSAKTDLHPYLRQEAMNQYLRANELIFKEQSSQLATRQQALHLPGLESPTEHAKKMQEQVPAWNRCSQETRDSLMIAEFLFQCASHSELPLDFSRNIGFSYCFAVENEAKERTQRKVKRFLADQMNIQRIRDMLEPNARGISVYYHQYILRMLQEHPMDITVDNVRITLSRLLEHQSHFKPDGLKALGILILLFGRTYEWSKAGKVRKINNPLGLKGLETDAQVIDLANKLIELQHQRNPYVHPEISELEQLGHLRTTAFECIDILTQLV